MQRAKGASGEREIASIVRELTGWDVRRRVRQQDGDSDLEGVPGWSVEVKRHRSASRGEIAAWWRQIVRQAERAAALPVLFFRVDRDGWRAVWPLAVLLTHQKADYWKAYEWTTEGSAEAWAAAALAINLDRPSTTDKPTPDIHGAESPSHSILEGHAP